MYAFDLSPPDEPARRRRSLLAKNEEAKLLAGGHSLLPTMKQRLAAPPTLIDLAGIPGLSGIERSRALGDDRRHDPACRGRDLARRQGGDPGARRARRGARRSGRAQPRHHRRLGRQQRSRRPIIPPPPSASAPSSPPTSARSHADEFFKGLFETALEEGEIITKVSFPIPQKAGYKKFRNPASRYALVGVFVAKRSGEIRVAVTGAGANGVFRWAEAEAALAKRFAPQSLEGLAASAGRAQQRHPRRCRLPRPSHRRHGPPRRQGRRRAVIAHPCHSGEGGLDAAASEPGGSWRAAPSTAAV